MSILENYIAETVKFTEYATAINQNIENLKVVAQAYSPEKMEIRDTSLPLYRLSLNPKDNKALKKLTTVISHNEKAVLHNFAACTIDLKPALTHYTRKLGVVERYQALFNGEISNLTNLLRNNNEETPIVKKSTLKTRLLFD